MKLSIIGTSYVGLVTGACLADVGNDVLCIDTDEVKIGRLQQGDIPIYEPGLQAVVKRNVDAGRLSFSSDPTKGALFSTIQFVAVGTPPDEDGSADLSHVLAAAREIGRHMDGPRVIANKSTVPVGTAVLVREAIQAELDLRGSNLTFSVVSNPEFLKEGAAIEDFTRPDRIIIGSDDADATALLRSLYAPFGRNHERVQVMDVASAELTKYAANAMLATRISFMNELALLAEDLGADIDMVRKGIGSDDRIGHHFLYAGCGYGGACFPKDVKALVKTGEERRHSLDLLRAVELVNEKQKRQLGLRIVERFGVDLSGLRIALWGLAFKPNTDDMREAPSRVLIHELLLRGATLRAYDPVAMGEAKKLFSPQAKIEFVSNAMEALQGADALAIVTEWKEFRSPDFDRMKAMMRSPVVFDGRNLYEPQELARHGFEYRSIGRQQVGKTQASA